MGRIWSPGTPFSSTMGNMGKKSRDLVLCALFAALLALCAWLSVPVGDLAVSMQSFGVLLALGLLGGGRGTGTILTYLVLGAVGLPVFSGFRGGLGHLLGPTGGYLWGFLAGALVYWLGITCTKGKLSALHMASALLCCYVCGTIWYGYAYLNGNYLGAALRCVLPYLLPDLGKLLLADLLSRRLKRHLP